MTRPLRIAQVAPPLERVPPHGYGGTERIVHELVRELVRRGHDVTTFASGDSDVPGRLIPTVPDALRPAGFGGDPSPWFLSTVLDVLERAREFDIIHSHIEWYSPILSRVAPVPVATTWHGRLDFPWAGRMLAGEGNNVAISRSQAATHPDVPWAAVVHNGLSLEGSPFERRGGDDLCFVGRVAPEKGIVESIEIAKLSGRRIRIAAKRGYTPHEQAYYENAFLPALKSMGGDAEYLGELPGADRDRLFAESYATLMPGSWPEPFGLVAIESLACGTPLLAHRVGALPEILRHGKDGFFGDDVSELAFAVDRVATLDREAIRASVLERFSAGRMTDDYERLYRKLVAAAGGPLEAEPSTTITGPARVAVRIDTSGTDRPWSLPREVSRSGTRSSADSRSPTASDSDASPTDATSGSRRGG
jgi:glycosyltransferase involved in cell wall biosynthesis